MPNEDKLKAGQDYKLRTETDTVVDARIEKTGVPIYLERLELSDVEKEKLQKEIWAEWLEIKKEREEKKLEEKWAALDNQYDGVLEEDEARMFNIDRGITQIKVDKVVSLIMQAFMESDPKYSITPRPEFTRQGGVDVCDKQSDFIDDRLDNLPFREPEGQVVHSAVLKGTGFTKIKHLICRENRRREERYKGNPMMGFNDDGSPMIDPRTGQQVIRNKGLEEFLNNWPDAAKDYPGLIKKLQAGEEINIIANYKDTTYNDPEFSSVNLKDFYARLSCNGYEGLKNTKLTVERISYSWWDLKKFEKEDTFYDIDKLAKEYKDGVATDKQAANYENKYYDILECVYYYADKEGKEDIKIVAWFGEESKVNIGAILYPYFLIDCYYVPHYIMKKEPGLYGKGIGERLTGSSIAGNAILNFTLEGAWLTNSVTPITKDQDIIDQFLEKRFMQGIPITGKPGDVDFLNKYMRPLDVNGLLNLLQYIKQDDDDKSRVSSLMSGRSDPLDPSAPAEKSMALLQQSGIDIKDFQLSMAPAFNEIGYIILNMYFQMSREGRKYSPKVGRVTGDNPFAEISRNDMSARTNIQVMAASFDFDKINLKKELVAFLQMFRQEPLIAGNPETVQMLLKFVVKNWNPLFRNLADQILPSVEEIKKKEIMVALQALDMYIKGKQQEAQVTGVAPAFDARELVPMINQMVSEIATLPPKEVLDERVKQAKENAPR